VDFLRDEDDFLADVDFTDGFLPDDEAGFNWLEALFPAFACGGRAEEDGCPSTFNTGRAADAGSLVDVL
jgi:hypothetical protein